MTAQFDFALGKIWGQIHKKIFEVLSYNYCNFLVSRTFSMYFFLKYIVTLFYKNLRIKIVVCLLRESGPSCLLSSLILICIINVAVSQIISLIFLLDILLNTNITSIRLILNLINIKYYNRFTNCHTI